MSDQTYLAKNGDTSSALSDDKDVLHLVESLLDIGVDKITIQTADSKTIIIEPSTHLSINDFIKEINGE